MKKIQFLLAFMVQCLIHGQTYEECPEENEECEFYFAVNEELTMNYEKGPVYADDGHLYKDVDGTIEPVPVDKVITMDGIKRTVVTVNNTIPGPPIIVYKGQKVVVHVINNMYTESITIHWHGMHQKGTQYSDGVPFITQCPISPGQHFAYNFTASPHGTFFYHSHLGGQRIDGLFGALIVKKRTTKDESTEDAPKDVIMHVGDWLHARSSVAIYKARNGEIKANPNFIQAYGCDGTKFQGFMWDSGYVEGRGRYQDPATGNWTEAPHQIYNVEENKKYRFRVIGSGIMFSLRVSVDNHLITMVAADGYDIKPVVVESFIINPGERYDFILEANQAVGNYWIRVKSMECNLNHTVQAVLRYAGAAEIEPRTSSMSCTAEIPCRVLNCPFLYFHEDNHTECIQINALEATDGEPVPTFVSGDSLEYFMNWANIGGKMLINGNFFKFPDVSAMSQPEEIRDNITCDSACADDEICSCYHQLDIPFDKTIQMIWSNHGTGGKLAHPIHLHGHSFHVMKIGYGYYDNKTGQYLNQNEDINCGGTEKDYCNRPTWNNNDWEGDNIPGMNLDNPPQKDTLMLPGGTYAVIRFRSDNPGKWFSHCHVEFHSMNGMEMVINEAAEMIPPPPPGYPECKNFYHNPDLNDINPGDMSETYIFMGLFVACIVIVLIENLVLVVLYCRWKRGHSLPFGSNVAPSNYDSVKYSNL